jgi:hypothetical protein
MKYIVQTYHSKTGNIEEKFLPYSIETGNFYIKNVGVQYETKKGIYTGDFEAWIFSSPRNKKAALKMLKKAIKEEKQKQDKILLLFMKPETFEVDETDSNMHDLICSHKEKLMKPVIWLGKDYVGHIFCRTEDKKEAIKLLKEKTKKYMKTNPAPRIFV